MANTPEPMSHEEAIDRVQKLEEQTRQLRAAYWLMFSAHNHLKLKLCEALGYGYDVNPKVFDDGLAVNFDGDTYIDCLRKAGDIAFIVENGLAFEDESEE